MDTKAKAVRAPFAWPGGKRALTKTLLGLIPAHEIYVEVFAGSAKLLFAKPQSRREVMNDLNGDVTNFFRVVKHRAAELAERMELECIHAGRFRELREATPECEVERALRFAYLAWYSFGAKGEHFASSSAKSDKTKRSILRVRELLSDVAQRLASVQIEQRDFRDILTRYDAKGSFFYLDPPYVCFQPNGRYEPLAEERREELFAALAKLQGRFLMSFDDHPEIRRRAKEHGFKVRSVTVPYTISSAGPKDARELLVANFGMAAV